MAHRDLKPDNILFDDLGHLKISDFGTSDVFKTAFDKIPHLSRGLCGSEPFIAPEEFNNLEYDAREVDIWASGVIFYCMLYAGTPWKQATQSDMDYNHYLKARRQKYFAIDCLPFEISTVLYRILEPDPKQRLTVDNVLDSGWARNITICQNLMDSNGQRHRHICINKSI